MIKTVPRWRSLPRRAPVFRRDVKIIQVMILFGFFVLH